MGDERQGMEQKARRKKGSSDTFFWVCTVSILWGIGFLTLYFLAELPFWQSILLAPLGLIALAAVFLTWSWGSKRRPS